MFGSKEKVGQQMCGRTQFDQHKLIQIFTKRSENLLNVCDSDVSAHTHISGNTWHPEVWIFSKMLVHYVNDKRMRAFFLIKVKSTHYLPKFV